MAHQRDSVLVVVVGLVVDLHQCNNKEGFKEMGFTLVQWVGEGACLGKAAHHQLVVVVVQGG